MNHCIFMFIIHDCRIPVEYITELEKKLPQAEFLPFKGINNSSKDPIYGAILCHPDIYFFQLDDNTLIHAPGVPEQFLETLMDHGINLIQGEGDPYGIYPDTVRYNAVRIGDVVLCNMEYADPVLLNSVKERGLKSINVSQGYCRCSVIPVNEKAIITSDNGIFDAARNEGIEVLLVSTENILLPGQKYGFIGGCSGKTPDNRFILLGDIDTHPESSVMSRFFSERGRSFLDIKSHPLYDAGGLFILS